MDIDEVGDLEAVEAELADSPTLQHRPSPTAQRIAEFKEQYRRIDAREECARWACFRDEDDWDDLDDLDDFDAMDPLRPTVLSQSLQDVGPAPCIAPPNVGRNDPCPCGSGKKFKKCRG